MSGGRPPKKEPIEKAVWLDSVERVRNVLSVLEQLYDSDMWLGGILFADVRGGYLLFATFNPDTYVALGIPWEAIFQADHLRSISLVEACTNWRRYRPWLGGDICTALRGLKLLPRADAPVNESHPSLAAMRAERDPPLGVHER